MVPVIARILVALLPEPDFFPRGKFVVASARKASSDIITLWEEGGGGGGGGAVLLPEPEFELADLS